MRPEVLHTQGEAGGSGDQVRLNQEISNSNNSTFGWPGICAEHIGKLPAHGPEKKKALKYVFADS
jgi:hypothetical protein